MNGWSLYWLCWFVASAVTFLVPEIYALASGRPGRTLSAQVWKLESLQTGQPIWQWSALHWLLGGLFATLLIWLLFHFTLGIWR
jgi:hypothetical protein